MSKSLWKECSGGEKKLKIQRKARFAEGEVWEPDHRTEFSKEQPLLHPQTGGKQGPESPHDLPTTQPGPRSPVFFFLCRFFSLAQIRMFKGQ